MQIRRIQQWKIRRYHECEGRIEKSVPRIAVWHHVAFRVMTNVDLEGRIFLSYPHTNNGFFFLLTTLQLESLRMNSKFELDLYFMMLTVSFCTIWMKLFFHSKVIDRKPQFSQNLSKKSHNSDFHVRTCPVINDALPFCKVWIKLMHLFNS